MPIDLVRRYSLIEQFQTFFEFSLKDRYDRAPVSGPTTVRTILGDFNQSLQVPFRGSVVLLVEVHREKLFQRRRVIRFLLQSLLVGGDRLVQFSIVRVEIAPAVIGIPFIGGELDVLVDRPDRPVGVSQLVVTVGELVVCDLVERIDLDRTFNVSYSLLGPTFRVVPPPSM